MCAKRIKISNLSPSKAEENRVRGKPRRLCLEDRDYHNSLLARKNREMKQLLANLHNPATLK